MLKPAHLLIILFVLTLAVPVHADNVITGKVVGVSDGDTIYISSHFGSWGRIS